MPGFSGMHVYLGKSLAGKGARPAAMLDLRDNGDLARTFRNDILRTQEDGRRFTGRIDIPELPPLEVEFVWIGQTAAAAFWVRKWGELNEIGAATLLLNGVEGEQERTELVDALAARKVPITDEVWADIGRTRKPVAVTLYRDLYYLTDPVLATTAPMLAVAFFGLFGTGG